MTSAPCACRILRIILIAASCPSNNDAAVTTRTRSGGLWRGMTSAPAVRIPLLLSMALQVFDPLVHTSKVVLHFRLQCLQILDLCFYIVQMLTQKFAQLFKHRLRRSADGIDGIEVANFLKRKSHLFEPLDETK